MFISCMSKNNCNRKENITPNPRNGAQDFNPDRKVQAESAYCGQNENLVCCEKEDITAKCSDFEDLGHR